MKNITWNDITLAQYEQLIHLDANDMEDQIRAVEIILGVDADKMTWKELGGHMGRFQFLSEPIPQTIIRFHYKLNNHRYKCQPNPAEMTVSQFLDYQQAAKSDDLVKILATFLVPQGKEYGDYNIEQVYDDIRTMSIVDAMGILGFFQIALRCLSEDLADFSVRKMKTLSRKDRRTVRQAMESVITAYSSMSGQ